MEFYIELTDRLSNFRLQINGNWRKVENKSRELQESDFLTAYIFELVRMQKKNSSIEINGLTYKIEPDNSNEDRILNYNIFAKRDFFPFIPSKEQLRSVIKQGDDRVTNSLILNVYGFFELRNFFTIDKNIKDPTLVIRYETFDAGNEYVGEEPANDDKFINDLYKTFLVGWKCHLEGDLTNMYIDFPANEEEKILISEIYSLSDKWKKVYECKIVLKLTPCFPFKLPPHFHVIKSA